MYSDEDREASKGLDEFLAKIDEVGSLVKDLITSEGDASSEAALDKADKYLLKSHKEDCNTREDRLVINSSPVQKSRESAADVSSFCQSVEEDVKERAERRKERVQKGKALKKEGNALFKCGDYEEALERFAAALKETPWDVTLLTNRALTFNRLERYSASCVECDLAVKLEPGTLKAYIHKANALKALNEVKKARACLEMALKKCPNHKEDIQPYLDQLDP